MATAKNVPSTVVEMPPTCQLQVQCGIEIWTISTIMTAKTKTKRRVSQDRAVNKTTGWCDDDGDGRWTITIHTILWETQSEASLVYQPSSLRCTSPPVLAVSHGLRKCELGSEMLSCSSIVSYPLLFACFSQREKKYAHAHTHTGCHRHRICSTWVEVKRQPRSSSKSWSQWSASFKRRCSGALEYGISVGFCWLKRQIFQDT